jgi:hypothetical protein
VRAVEIRRPNRGVLAQQLVMTVRVAGTVHRVAGGLNEARRTGARSGGVQQGDRCVDVDAACQFRLPLDHGRDHRCQVDDHRR